MNETPVTIFSQETFSMMFPEGSGNHYWNLTKKWVVADLLRRIQPSGVLDIGAGAGVVTSYIKERGFPVWGTELAPVPTPSGLEGSFFSGKNLNELPLDVREKINTILLLDVIEHLPDPKTLLTEASATLPNLKYAVITVPARQELWSNLDEFNNHYLRYNRPGLSKVMKEAGWKTLYCGYYFQPLYWPALVVSKLGLNRSVELYGPKGIQITIHRVLAHILYACYKVLPRCFVGSSVVGVFKRSVS